MTRVSPKIFQNFSKKIQLLCTLFMGAITFDSRMFVLKGVNKHTGPGPVSSSANCQPRGQWDSIGAGTLRQRGTRLCVQGLCLW